MKLERAFAADDAHNGNRTPEADLLEIPTFLRRQAE